MQVSDPYNNDCTYKTDGLDSSILLPESGHVVLDRDPVSEESWRTRVVCTTHVQTKTVGEQVERVDTLWQTIRDTHNDQRSSAAPSREEFDRAKAQVLEQFRTRSQITMPDFLQDLLDLPGISEDRKTAMERSWRAITSVTVSDKYVVKCDGRPKVVSFTDA